MKKAFLALLISFICSISVSQNNLHWKTYAANYPCFGGSPGKPLLDNIGNIYYFYCFFDSANFIAPNGNHLIQTGPMFTGNIDVIILKMDPNGNIIYKGTIGGSGTNNEAVLSYAINQNNEILLAITSSEANVDVNPGPGITNIVNPMQQGGTGTIIIHYDANFNVLNTFTQFDANLNFVSSTQNNWILHFQVTPGTNVDIDISGSSQIVNVPSSTNMFTNVVAKFNAAGNYISDFRYEFGNYLNFSIISLPTSMHCNNNGDVFITGVNDDSARVNTISGPVYSIPGNGITSNVFFMRINASMQCVYYKNLEYTIVSYLYPEINGDDSGCAYVFVPTSQNLIDLDPGPSVVSPNDPNNNVGFSKYDAYGNLLNYVSMANSNLINNHHGVLEVTSNKILFTFLASAFSGPCIVNHPNGNSDIILTPNYDDFPISLVLDSSLQVITYLTLDTMSGNGNFYQNFGSVFTANGILWSMYTHDWMDTDFGNGFDTIPAASLAFVNIGGGLFAGTNSAEGKLYYDLDLNTNFSGSDLPLPYRFVANATNSYFSLTDTMGNYKLYLPNGSHTYHSGSVPPLYYNVNPLTHNSVFSTGNQNDINKDFRYDPTPGIVDVEVNHVIVSGLNPGAHEQAFVIVHNKGTVVANFDVKFISDSSMKYFTATPPFTSQSGDTLIWSNITLSPMQYFYSDIQFYVDSLTPIGHTFQNCSQALCLSDVMQSDNFYCDSNQIVGPYDPNFKEVNWGTQISVSEMSLLPWFNYTIHFQNTGNDTAINIHIIDTLRHYFDLTSFELLSSSHSVQPVYLGNRIIDFKFNTIMLPDSNVNELKSHGYVNYRVKPSQNWPAGTHIQNGAAIYFDFNAPVITSPMITTVTSPLGIRSSTLSEVDFKMYPNPNQGILRIQSSKGVKEVMIYSLFGTECAKYVIYGGERDFSLSLEPLTSGVYLIEVKGDESIGIQKLILNR